MSLWTSVSIPTLILQVTSSRIYLYSLIFITFLHALIEAHTHKHTYMICTQEEWQQPGTGAWLGRAEEGFVKDNSLSHTKKDKWQHAEISNLKRFKQIKLPAKLLDCFLWSNKSNINLAVQTVETSHWAALGGERREGETSVIEKIESNCWMGTEIGMLRGYWFQGQVKEENGSNNKVNMDIIEKETGKRAVQSGTREGELRLESAWIGSVLYSTSWDADREADAVNVWRPVVIKNSQ